MHGCQLQSNPCSDCFAVRFYVFYHLLAFLIGSQSSFSRSSMHARRHTSGVSPESPVALALSSSSRRAWEHVTWWMPRGAHCFFGNGPYAACIMPRGAYSNSDDTRNTIWAHVTSMSHRTRGVSDGMGTCHITRDTRSARDIEEATCAHVTHVCTCET